MPHFRGILAGSRRLAFAALLAAVVPFAIASCGARLDDAHMLTRKSAAPHPSRFAEVEGAEASSPSRRSFPIRPDTRMNADKARRGVAMAGDPRARPTVQERREAKGAAMQEWDLLINGGMPQYKGDGSSSNINSVKFGAAPGALTLDYYAAPSLNLSDGAAHALTLVVYHLSDRAAFDQLAGHEQGIRKLLEGDYFDASVVGVRKHDIQPGSSARLVEDRAERGKYVALVAGYGSLRARTAVYVAEYRLYQWQMKGGTIFSRDTAMYSPYPLHLRAVLYETAMRVDDTDAMLDRMHRVTNIQRRQAYSRLRPSYRGEAGEFIQGETGAAR